MLETWSGEKEGPPQLTAACTFNAYACRANAWGRYVELTTGFKAGQELKMSPRRGSRIEDETVTAVVVLRCSPATVSLDSSRFLRAGAVA